MAKEPQNIILIPELNSAERGTFQLEVSTRKYSNGQIVSAAHAQWSKNGMVSFLLCGDFRKTVLRHSGTATQKKLNQQHEIAFNADYLPVLKAEVVNFYYEMGKSEREDAA